MRRLFLIPVFVFCVLAPARAQFIGYTSPQTQTQTVLNAVSTPQLVQVLNVGQSYHTVCYTTTGNPIFILRIVSSFDGTNWQPLSDDATSQSSGCIYGQGAFPFVAVDLVKISSAGSPTITAFYTGTSGTSAPPTGALNQSQTYRKTLYQTVTGTQSITLNPPCGNTSGTVYFIYNTGNGPGGTLGLTFGADTLTSTGVNAPTYSLTNTANVQPLTVPAFAATSITISVTPATGANYTAYYNFQCPAGVGNGGAAPPFSGPIQPYPSNGATLNSESVSGTNAAVAYTVPAVQGYRAVVFEVNARCSAGTAQITIADGAQQIWSSATGEVGTTSFKMGWSPGLTSSANNGITVTLGTCGAGNTGTLDVQASQI